MNRLPMSLGASSLLRALVGRAGVARDRVLLTHVQSADWRSLTFSGERHQIELRITPLNAHTIVDRMCLGLEEAEFSIPGVIVADIGVAAAPSHGLDGSINVTIEALTVSED